MHNFGNQERYIKLLLMLPVSACESEVLNVVYGLVDKQRQYMLTIVLSTFLMYMMHASQFFDLCLLHVPV